jgi:hypothetical protein
VGVHRGGGGFDSVAGSLPVASFTKAIVLILLLVTISVFAQTTGFQFVNLDDPINVYDNRVLSGTWQGLVEIWRRPYFGLYIPVTYTAWWSTAALAGGASAGAFHLANLLVHVLNVLLVFQLLRTLVPKSVFAAAAGAAYFAIHPIHVEPVAWVTSMKDLLSAFFTLACLIVFVRFAERKRAEPWLYSAGTVLFLCALLSKPSSVVVPGLAWLLTRKRAAWLVPWAVVSMLFAIYSAALQGDATTPMYMRPLVAIDALGFYVFKTILPIHHVANYDHGIALVLALKTWPHVLTGLGFVAASWWIGWPAFFFAVALLPNLGFVPFNFQFISTTADRYAYLAVFGVSWGCAILLRRHRHQLAVLVAGGVLFACLLLSGSQVSVWKDSRTLFEHTLSTPGGDRAMAHLQLGEMLRREGRTSESLEHTTRAVELRPDSAALTAHGVALYSAGRHLEATSHLRRALELNPLEIDARWGLGSALIASGNGPEGEEVLVDALRRAPRYLPALYALCGYYKASSQKEKAAQCLAQLIKLDPLSDVAKKGAL